LIQVTRRGLLKVSAGGLLPVVLGGGTGVIAPAWAPARAQGVAVAEELTAEQWMHEWMSLPKAPGATLHVSRFVEPIYFVTRPIAWRPNPDQVAKFEAVEVPKGFVTDLASVPKPFWKLLRPDGEYTYAAIVHDFLYWTQARSREAADHIFKLSMEDFKIDARIVALLHSAARVAGGSAWRRKTELKAKGEKRILKRFPDDPRVRWQDWKKRPGVFA
jgi:uncharacterized protein DUF1353